MPMNSLKYFENYIITRKYQPSENTTINKLKSLKNLISPHFPHEHN